MATYRVFGEIPVYLTVTVEAESMEEAIDLAHEEFEGMENYVGNGGTDRMIGVIGPNDTVEAPDACEAKFTNAELA